MTVSRTKIESVVMSCENLPQLESAKNFIKNFEMYVGEKHARKYWWMILEKEVELKRE